MGALPNQARGEVMIVIDGAPHILCVTLGALAQLETAFNAPSFAHLGDRLKMLNAHDLLIVLSALLGAEGRSVAQLAASHIDPKAAAVAVGEAFRLAFDDEA
jgi:hypothetical protein